MVNLNENSQSNLELLEFIIYSNWVVRRQGFCMFSERGSSGFRYDSYAGSVQSLIGVALHAPHN